MPYDPELAEQMRNTLKTRPGIQEKKMFGGYCWMLNGNMLCGVEVGRYMFRVGKDLEPVALSRAGASPMDITGRPMKGIIWVNAMHAQGGMLEDWINLALSFVNTLPPK